jgi:hypothetical protein
MYPVGRYEGPLEAGAVFRHRSFDILCEFVEVSEAHVVAYPLDCDGKQGINTVLYTVGSFRDNWVLDPHTDRWGAKFTIPA